ncbi:protein-tyrosine phosphatase family protein [Spongiactinospora sp. TRM90649]|uniref:protein-tyrosine phosphatase family protein n=1 Tax=Spongiactinospora sp. TRM90649 TaxID=3031114 RepID=UPI0023F64476|nr:protein-tyrosine phosphatase family protein [Spongiactinospora sp. TRM90649]MDF5752272.1 protein-tyrosine phosphatase family protein [Spongiactinospora sp. TRM90649]
MTRSPLTGAIRLPGGAWVRGRGLRNPPPGGPTPEFGLYLGSARLRRTHEGAIHWTSRWLDWPDFLLPRDREQAVRGIRLLREQAQSGLPAEVACGGGVGRTGTVLACLAVLDGLDPDEAVAWVRAAHHPRAVETPWQRRWVRRFPRD